MRNTTLFALLNLDTFKEGQWRILLGGRFYINDLSRFYNLSLQFLHFMIREKVFHCGEAQTRMSCRMCNGGNHPLKGKHLITMTHSSPPTVFFTGDPQVTFFAFFFQKKQLLTTSHQISEGVEVEVGNIIAERLGYSVKHFYAMFHFLPLPGNTFGGALGEVSWGEI